MKDKIIQDMVNRAHNCIDVLEQNSVVSQHEAKILRSKVDTKSRGPIEKFQCLQTSLNTLKNVTEYYVQEDRGE